MKMKVSFLQNPRFEVDRGAKDRGEPCPFWFTPDCLTFRNFEVGGIYELSVELRNVTKVGRRLRVMPCRNPVFSNLPLRYEGDVKGHGPGSDFTVVAPGMAAHLAVRFAPDSLIDQSEQLVIGTELGDYTLPVLARRIQPDLKVEDPYDCGCILAGNSTTKVVQLTNQGGEGSFRLIADSKEEAESSYHYETRKDGETTFVSGPFRITPAAFYLEARQSTHVTVRFSTDEVGQHQCTVLVECDNGVKTPMTLVAVTDALRLEVTRWPSLQAPVVPQRPADGVSPWSLVPWQVSWLGGLQVGCRQAQTIELSNGGYLPMEVQWRFAQPSKTLLSRLAVGSQSRLTEEIVSGIHQWPTLQSGHGPQRCPFSVHPQVATIPPFTSMTFDFVFHSQIPVNHRSTAFAYLVASGVPFEGQCLLHQSKLLDLQSEMQPEGYRKGLPLFGGAVSAIFDPQPNAVQPETGSCVVTALCLQGLSCSPTVVSVPPALVLPGEVLPFVSHRREITLHNSGSMPARFKVRVTSRATQVTEGDPLWIVTEEEAGPKPEDELEVGLGDQDTLEAVVRRLISPWPPLPPKASAALATLAVEPHLGTLAPGESATLTLTLRAPREADIAAELLVDLVTGQQLEDLAALPIKVPITAAVRAPRVDLRKTSFLDYGVVRANARHSMSLIMENPTPLPVLVRLKQLVSHAEDAEIAGLSEGAFPLQTHQEVVDFFRLEYGQGARRGFSSIALPEVSVELQEGHGTDSLDFEDWGLTKPPARSQDDFLFEPSCLVLWPFGRAEVQATLKAGDCGKFRAFLAALSFDSPAAQCVQALAEIQLPRLRLSTHHLKLPVAYAGIPSEQNTVELRNDSDLPSDFKWLFKRTAEVPFHVHLQPTEGRLPPRGRVDVQFVVVPTKEAENAALECRVLAEAGLQPQVLKISAKVYGPEVDYAVLQPGELPPVSLTRPRQPEDPQGSTFQISTGTAAADAPIIDFGEMEIQQAKVVQLVLYNRTAIFTPFAARIADNPAWEPATSRKAAELNQLLLLSKESLAVTESASDLKQTFLNEPQPAALGRKVAEELDITVRVPSKAKGTRELMKTMQSTLRSKAGKKRRPLLDDKHEKQAFRSNFGAEFAKQKELKEAGMVALKVGRGFAVKLEPSCEMLQPFGRVVITLTCFSDLPGLLEDFLILNLPKLKGHGEGQDFRIPVRLKSFGNPLYLPDQQVGVNVQLSPPRLLCGTIVPAERVMTRRFKVANGSAAKIKISWKVYPKMQVESAAKTREFVSLALCGQQDGLDHLLQLADLDERDIGVDEQSEVVDSEANQEDVPFHFSIWAPEPPPVADPFAVGASGDLPLLIEPTEAVLEPHGTCTFNVSMICSKATPTAEGHYRYMLVGKGSFTEDRAAQLAAALGLESPTRQRAATKKKTMALDQEVANLPAMKVHEGLDADDSDYEPLPDEQDEQHGRAMSGADVGEGQEAGKRPLRSKPVQPLPPEPEKDVLSTIVVDCIGDCILPRLTVDKKEDDGVDEFPLQNASEDHVDGIAPAQGLHCPMFKFTHAAILAPFLQKEKPRVTGTIQGGAVGGAQIPGVVSALVRQVNLTNTNTCSISCMFHTEGPFRIRQISQAGKFPIQLVPEVAEQTKKKRPPRGTNEESMKHLLIVEKRDTISLQVEFVPEMVPASQWSETKWEHVFHGDLVLEYPRDVSNTSETAVAPKNDLQRVHLVASSRRPAVRVTVVPKVSLDSLLRPELLAADPKLVFVEFGVVHVNSSITHRRAVLLSNETNILARWQLLHVGRKRSKIVDAAAGEDEEASALDEREVFEFDLSAGELLGPSKDGAVEGSGVRMPHWCPSTSALPHALPAEDEHLYHPQKILIAFKPKKDQLYQCRFRIQVEAGLSFDFVCRGRGSSKEEDDIIDFKEA